MEKYYVFANSPMDPLGRVYIAIAENGEVIKTHISSCDSWAKMDLKIEGKEMIFLDIDNPEDRIKIDALCELNNKIGEATPSDKLEPLNPAVQEILLKMKKDIDKATSSSLYLFDEKGPSQEELMEFYKIQCNEWIEKSGLDNHITESINKTGWPDRVILQLIDEEGYMNGTCTIDKFKEIQWEWIADESKNSFGMQLSVTLVQKIKRISIEIDIPVKDLPNESSEITEEVN